MMGAMKTLRTFLLPFLLAACALAHASEPECVIPSKPGGAMDLTCKLAQNALQGKPGAAKLKLTYLPGGIGAVAWHTLVSQRRAEPEYQYDSTRDAYGTKETRQTYCSKIEKEKNEDETMSTYFLSGCDGSDEEIVVLSTKVEPGK